MTIENPETQPLAAEITENPAEQPAPESAVEPEAELVAAAPDLFAESAPAPAIEAAAAPVAPPAIEAAPEPAPEPAEDFGELLAEFEKTHARAPKAGTQLQGTVISVSAEQVFLDIGFKIEGVLPRT